MTTGDEHTSADRAPGHESAPRDVMTGEVIGQAVSGDRAVPDAPAGQDDATAHVEPFWVGIPAYQGTLASLVLKAQRGEVDLTAVPVGDITARYRADLVAGELGTDPREVADFLGLASRLLTLKAGRLLPDSPLTAAQAEEEADPDLSTEPGRRLAEYRLFKAAAEALLSDAADEGARSFLGLVAPEIVPVERLRIPAERLAAAFRAVLERIAGPEPLPIGTITFSVADKAEQLRALLAAHVSVQFESIFEGVTSRLEAVAIFLGLLELLRNGEARVEQLEAFGGISVTRVE